MGRDETGCVLRNVGGRKGRDDDNRENRESVERGKVTGSVPLFVPVLSSV